MLGTKKRGARRLPKKLRMVPAQMLENNLRREGDAAGIAGKHLRRLVEHRLAWNREVVNRRLGESDGGHVADQSAHILGMVEDVVEASGELDLEVFLEGHRLGEGGIDVIRRVEALGVAAGR